MNVESIKDFFKATSEAIYYKVKDSTLFNILLEKYDNLDIHHQKWIQRIFIMIRGLLFLSIPSGCWMASLNYEKEFKTKKTLVYQMLQNSSKSSSHQATFKDMESQISVILSSLSEEQPVKITRIMRFAHLPTSLKDLKYVGKKIKIDGLNIEEAIQIGQKFNYISPSVKLLHFKATEMKEKENYFTATYSVIQFTPPSTSSPRITPLSKKRKKRV